jgi:hypothetical protein
LLNTYSQCWKYVLERCPLAGPMMAQEWIQWSFRKIGETRSWSWLQKPNQFLVPDAVNSGTVNLAANDQTVFGVGTTWDGSEVGKQFRTGLTYPIYDIGAVDTNAQSLTLTQPWGGPAIAGTGYQIYRAYYTVPEDFHSFITVWDPAYNWQLWTRPTQFELNIWDSQRASSGNGYCVSFRDYNSDFVAAGSPALPRYEIWPQQYTQKCYPYLYEARWQDLNDTGAALPRYIRGDVLVEGALWQCAMWPGASPSAANPYFNLTLAKMHQDTFMKAVYELERQDDELNDQIVTYTSHLSLPWAPFPFADSRFLQSHAF